MDRIKGELLFLFTIISFQLCAQILPKEGQVLNYRIVGFSTPQKHGADKYTLEIAAGNFDNEDSFKKNIVVTQTSEHNKIIAKVPYWGKQYTWQIVSAARNKRNSLHHFSTGYIPWIDTNVARLRILQPAQKHSDAYVFVDGIAVLYDMSGEPVWYLPEIDSSVFNARDIRDLKLSPQGTITLLLNNLKQGNDRVQAYEINYNGDILWKGPNDGRVNKDSNEHYHHEFTRLANGHYIVLGDEYQYWKLESQDSNLVNANNAKIKREHNILSQQLQFGNIIEYDEKARVVWSWKSSDYALKSDLYNRRIQNGLFNIGIQNNSKPNISDMHENAFYFDESNKVIYVSFRNISRVIKISYPGGEVMDTYGELYIPGIPETGNTLFCAQHSCRLSRQGYLYLYNNGCSAGADNTVVIMQADPSEKLHLKKIWEYQCATDKSNGEGMAGGGLTRVSQGGSFNNFSQKSKPFDLTSGGNVMEMPDGALFVSMCVPNNRIFIVSPDRNILWSAIPEKYNIVDKKWLVVNAYRCSIIDNDIGFERLIWN